MSIVYYFPTETKEKVTQPPHATENSLEFFQQ